MRPGEVWSAGLGKTSETVSLFAHIYLSYIPIVDLLPSKLLIMCVLVLKLGHIESGWSDQLNSRSRAYASQRESCMSMVKQNIVILLPKASSDFFTDCHNVKMLFFSFFKTLVEHEVTVELKNDILIRGTLKSVDQYLNIKLDDISVVDEIKYPHLVSEQATGCPAVRKKVHCHVLIYLQSSVKNVFIRGSVVRYVHLPANAVDTPLLEDATRRGVFKSIYCCALFESDTDVNVPQKPLLPQPRPSKVQLEATGHTQYNH